MKIRVACLLVLLVGSLLAAGGAYADDVHGVLQVVKGDVQIKSGKDGTTTKAKIGGKVFPKDTIVTGKDSRAKVVMVDNNVLNVSPDSKIEIQNYEFAPEQGKKEVLLNVLYGKVRSKVEQKYEEKGNTFQVKTPTAVAGVRGTDFIAGYDASTSTSSVVTFHGSVAFGQPGPGGTIANSVPVTPGTMASMNGSAPPAPPVAVPPAQLASMDKDSSSEAVAPKDERQPADVNKKDGKKEDDKGDKKDGDKGEAKKEGDKADAKKDGDKGGRTEGDKGDKNGAKQDGDKGGRAEGDRDGARQEGDKGGGRNSADSNASNGKGPNGGGDSGKGPGGPTSPGGSPGAGASGPNAGLPAGEGGAMPPGGTGSPGAMPRDPASAPMPGGGMGGGSMLRPEDFASAPNSAVMPVVNGIMPVLPPPAALPPPVPVCEFCNRVIQDGNTTLNIHVTH